MIRYVDIKRHEDLPFEDYLKLGGYSFSFLKREILGILPEFKETDKVIIGRIVDEMLTGNGITDMRHKLYPIAKSIAYEIKIVFGSFISSFQKQVSFTANMQYQGFEMRTTGRIDYLLPGHAVIDLKVTHEKDIDNLIRRMHYPDQTWNYANLAGVKGRFIMIYSVPLKKAFMKNVGSAHPRNDFWEDKVLKFGSVMQAV